MEKIINKIGIAGVYLFGISLVISKSGINIGLVLMIASSVFYIKNFSVKKILIEQRLLLLALLGIIILGVFSDGGIKSAEISLKKSYRYIPIFIIPLFLNEKYKIERLINLISYSIVINFINGMLIYKKNNWNFSYRYESFTNINDGSHILAALSFLILGYIGYLYSNQKKRKMIFFLFIYLIIIIMIVLSQTRASWLALISGLLIFCILLNWKKALLLLTIVNILFFGLKETEIYKNNLYIKRFKSIKDINSDSPKIRIILWKSCINIYKENPIFGVGRDNSPKYFLEKLEKNRKYDEVQNKQMLKEIAVAGNPHSMYFIALVEEGIGAFLLFYFWIYILISEINFMLKNRKNHFEYFILVGCICATISSYISGLTEDSWRTFWRANMYVIVYALYLSIKRYILERNCKLDENINYNNNV